MRQPSLYVYNQCCQPSRFRHDSFVLLVYVRCPVGTPIRTANAGFVDNKWLQLKMNNNIKRDPDGDDINTQANFV